MKVVLDRYATLLVGWTHMWPGGFTGKTGSHDDPDLVYAQVEFKF